MYQVGLVAIIGSVYFIIAAIIFWRRSDDWPALFTATTLVTFGATFPGATEAILITRTGGQMPPSFYSVVGGIVFMIFFYSLFPDGRFVPTWTRYLAFGWVAFSFYSTLYPSSSLSIGTWYGSRQALILGWLAIGVGSQVYRYRRVSSPLQRQQTKWIVSGSLVGYSVAASFIFAILFIPDLGHTGRAMILYSIAGGMVRSLCILLIPISIGFAILRYRLWNIDLLINRTLVYVPLTAILAGIYAATVALLQRLFVAITGQISDAAIVITTLVLTATFTPIKNSLQSFVDNRFKEVSGPASKLRALDSQMQSVLDVLDAQKIARKVLNVSVAAFEAQGGVVYLSHAGRNEPLYATEGWDGDAAINLNLQAGGRSIGAVSLGKRRDGQDYSKDDRERLQSTIAMLAESITLARSAKRET